MKRARGMTLIELVVAIAIIGIAAATLVGVLASTSSRSGEALVASQATQIAAAYFDEAFGQPYASIASVSHTGARDHNGVQIAGLSSYDVDVVVANIANFGPASIQARRITVTVTDPRGGVTTLVGYRTNHP
ncbi:MAG TPA: prepilin-type N-terminal cleavage/methylation domain-containing protein [Povalibacter sp.]|jgi:MSHA pilin protein MshD|nr:prepilin-type N-terminal cleavage/methylation domain-containing protein [Povalibacter sp.]